VNVDLVRLQRRFRALRAGRPYDIYVGHLAHLLPIRDVVVLRCHPLELRRRLERGRRGRPADRDANAVAEAIDVVLREALVLGRRVWEVDTTGRSPTEVAALVERRLTHRGPTRRAGVDWLADPRVTAYLLDRAP
jgi:adenylate kinase